MEGERAYCAVLGLGDKEIDDRSLDCTPDGEDDVCVPSDLGHGYGPGELIQHASSRNSEAGETHALGAHLEGQDLNRVQSLQRGETDRVDGTEDEYECKASGSGGFVCALGTACGNRLLIESSRNGHGKPNNAATDVGEEEQRSPTNAVYQIGTEESPAKLLTVVDEDDIGLSEIASNSNGIQDFGHEV